MKGCSHRRFAVTAGFILCGHALGLAFLSLFRLLQYAALRGMAAPTDCSVWPAFMRGLWLDNVFASAVVALPAMVLLVAACFGAYQRVLRKAFVWWMSVFYAIMFALSAANIPYFHYFFKTINSGIFAWFGYAGTTAGMVAGERSYLIYIVAFAIAVIVFVRLLILLRRKADTLIAQAASCRRSHTAVAMESVATLLFAGLIVLGIRGHAQTDMAPVKVSQAYYCTDPFLNQLAIPPVFNVVTSLIDDMKRDNAPLNLMADSEAVAATRESLGIEGRADSAFVLRRRVTADEQTVSKRNVVIILMESMSADLMQTFGQKRRLTPTLDSLFAHSLAFTNCYSAGIHTNNGITATLYSFPALMRRNVMKREGSQGQNKTFVVALKLAQFDFLKRTAAHTVPILLLDDIFDKLDAKRVEQIVRLVSGDGFGQILITDTNRDHLDSILHSCSFDYKIFEVENGEITERECSDAK